MRMLALELIPDINFSKIWNIKYKNEQDKKKFGKSIWKFYKFYICISDLVNTMI